jgi:hypothetical protein
MQLKRDKKQIKIEIMAYIDYKVTSWVRVYIDNSQIDEAQKMIKHGSLPGDLIDELEPNEIENLLDVEEYLPIEENDGQATIELYSERSELLYSNDQNNKDNQVKNPLL